MKLQPSPPYFYIRIPKQEQTERKEKIGSIYIPPTHVFMGRGVQHGEIVAIGEDAHDTFPAAKVGDLLIVHHFCEGKEAEGTDDKKYHIQSDERYNYYLVTCFSYNGRGNETYGVWNGKEVIPHPDYIFLEDDAPVERLSPEELHLKGMQQKGSLFLFNNWKESREEKTKKMQQLKFEVQELARTVKTDEYGREYMPDEVKMAIENKEQEMKVLGRDSQKKEFLPYKVAWPNETLSEAFDEEIKNGDTVYARNDASQTKIEFNKVSYRVVKINYIGATQKWLKSSLVKFRNFKRELAL